MNSLEGKMVALSDANKFEQHYDRKCIYIDVTNENPAVLFVLIK
jgi:hypothetical protein